MKMELGPSWPVEEDCAHETRATTRPLKVYTPVRWLHVNSVFACWAFPMISPILRLFASKSWMNTFEGLVNGTASQVKNASSPQLEEIRLRMEHCSRITPLLFGTGGVLRREEEVRMGQQRKGAVVVVVVGSVGMQAWRSWKTEEERSRISSDIIE